MQLLHRKKCLQHEAAIEPVIDSTEVKPAAEKEMSFDEIFTLKPEVFEPAAVDEDEEETEGSVDNVSQEKEEKQKGRAIPRVGIRP